MDDEELLRAVVGREHGSFEVFYARHERLIVSCVKKVLARYAAVYSEEDVEDIVSTTCLHLLRDDFKKLRAFDPAPGYTLSSWVGLIATHTALDALRRREPVHVSLDAAPESDPRGGGCRLP